MITRKPVFINNDQIGIFSIGSVIHFSMSVEDIFSLKNKSEKCEIILPIPTPITEKIIGSLKVIIYDL